MLSGQNLNVTRQPVESSHLRLCLIQDAGCPGRSQPPPSTSKSDLISRLTNANRNKPYTSFPKPELMTLATSRGLIKSGNSIDIITRLEEQDKKKQKKWAKAAARKPPISREDAAKWPVGAQVVPSESRKAFGPNDPRDLLQRRGPNGAPVYVELGFEYAYEKVAGPPRERRRILMNRDTVFDNEERVMEIMGGLNMGFYWSVKEAWRDKVSRDLGILYHVIGMEEWEIWDELGFKAKKEDFEDLDEGEKKRIDRLMVGSALVFEEWWKASMEKAWLMFSKIFPFGGIF